MIYHDPYYMEEKYSNKVDTNIFDGFDLSEVNAENIINFKKMRFKFIFRENIKVYVRKILSKI